jgi:hypothetical protein
MSTQPYWGDYPMTVLRSSAKRSRWLVRNHHEVTARETSETRA